MNFSESAAEKFMSLGISCIAFEDESYLGTGYETFDLDGIDYTVSPFSFFQSNWELNRRVAKAISDEYAGFEEKRILDLYAGAGNFSLHLARNGNAVFAVEENVFSVRDGERNVKSNKIRKYRFLKGGTENAKITGKFDLVLLDPPRPGLSKAAMERLLNISPEHIAYVSCNPSTFARDLGILLEHYDLRTVRMADFFPNTYHVESLAFLTRKPQ